MNSQAAQTGASTSNQSSDVFFTQTIVGQPFGLVLGRRQRKAALPFIEYRPGIAAKLAEFWQQDLENNAWRYARRLDTPVQPKASSLRNFLERHSLRLAVMSIVSMLLFPILFLALVWQLGLIDTLLATWF